MMTHNIPQCLIFFALHYFAHKWELLHSNSAFIRPINHISLVKQ